MAEADWAAIQDIDRETWNALPEATRRAIEILLELREEEEEEAALGKLRKRRG